MSNLSVHEASVLIGRRAILDRASLTFPAGAVTMIIGPNGAGKSTLLNVAAGHLRSTRGSVTLAGSDLRRLSAKDAARRRAVMPQDATVAFPFTVQEVVAMGRTPWPTSGATNQRIVSTALHVTALSDFADRQITTLSGGERQRAALARVLTQATPLGPGSVLLLDEPTSAMDISHAEATMRLLGTLAARGAAVVAVVHDLDAAAAYADRVVLMDRGRVDADGPVTAVCTENRLSRVYGTPIEVSEHDGRLRILPQRRARAAAVGSS